MGNAIGWLFTVVIVLAIVIAVLAWFYQRATREVSLVKTGVGGRKVVLDGGVIAIPYFTEVARVNMQTLRLEVRRAGEAALITKDRLRVDVGVEFYVAVIGDEAGITRAAQTLGKRTFHPDQLRELLEGKLVDALRSVAARMTMDELHENRGAFVAEVREGLIESLARNGLDLDSVSLTALDQTPFKALDENNAFNAVGMRKLAEVIATSKKERAQIDAEAEVSVRQAAMEANKRKLQIDLDEQEAQIAQVQQIETLKAAQLAEVARRKAAGEQAAAHAKIEMEQQIRAADIAREQSVRAAEIARDRQIQEAEIAHQRDLELANQDRKIVLAVKSQEESKAHAAADAAKARAEISRDLEIREAEIVKNRQLRTAEIELERDIEIAEQERQIIVAEKSRAESQARAAADTARVATVEASEALTTARQLAEAERRKAVSALAVQQEAENDASRTRLAAETEKAVANDRAEARRIEAEARKRARLAEAEANRAMIDAENTQSDNLVAMKLDLARLEALPKIVAEMVKPAEKIDSIRIHQVSGLDGGRRGDDGSSGSKPVVNQALDSILEMAVQLPALRKIGEQVGLSMEGGLSGVADSVLGGKAGAGNKTKE